MLKRKIIPVHAFLQQVAKMHALVADKTINLKSMLFAEQQDFQRDAYLRDVGFYNLNISYNLNQYISNYTDDAVLKDGSIVRQKMSEAAANIAICSHAKKLSTLFHTLEKAWNIVLQLEIVDQTAQQRIWRLQDEVIPSLYEFASEMRKKHLGLSADFVETIEDLATVIIEENCLQAWFQTQYQEVKLMRENQLVLILEEVLNKISASDPLLRDAVTSIFITLGIAKKAATFQQKNGILADAVRRVEYCFAFVPLKGCLLAKQRQTNEQLEECLAVIQRIQGVQTNN